MHAKMVMMILDAAHIVLTATKVTLITNADILQKDECKTSMLLTRYDS